LEEQAYIGELISALVYIYAGVRLLRLASRTGEVPERLLGAIFLGTAASFILYDLPIILASEALWTPLNLAGRIAFVPVPVLLALFTRRVFRPESAWASWLVWGSAVLLVGGVTGSVCSGDLEGFSIEDPWFWAEWTGYTLPFAWTGAEALFQHHQARRRLRMNLCKPLVCNRFLLWGCFGVLQVLVNVAVFPQYAEYERDSAFSATWDALIAVGEISSLVVILLSFFPPAFYRKWIGGAASTRTPTGDL